MKANLNIARKTLKRSLIKFFASLQNKSLWSGSRTRHGFPPPAIKLVRIIYDDHEASNKIIAQATNQVTLTGDRQMTDRALITSWPCRMQTDVSQDNDISQFIKLESMVIDTI